MATDRTESTRRGQSLAKTTTKHPYAAIEHRVIDSAAYAALTFSARSLLVLMARQLTKDNNGHLQATFSYMHRFGFSENTLSRAIADLIKHGMIYRTRSGGYQQGAAQYAVTWLPIRNRQGLFLEGFKPYAWRDWQPEVTKKKKTPPPKLMDTHRKNGEWTMPTTPKSEAGYPPKTEDNELMPCRGVNSAHQTRASSRASPSPLRSPSVSRSLLTVAICASSPERNHTMNTQWHHLIIDRLEDGGIHLEQQSGIDDPNVIHLHPEQLLFIARQLCGMKPETAGKVADLERRLAVLTDKMQDIICNKAFRSDLIEQCGYGFVYLAELDALVDLALEFDGGRLEPEYKEAPEEDDKPIHPPSAITQAKKTQPSATAERGAQLGLAV